MITNGVSIEVGGKKYHSWYDFGLYITNTDYIGDPVRETNYITIPGRSGFIDLSEIIAGRPVYSHRPINISFATSRPKEHYDAIISNLRNIFNGKEVKLIFDNDQGYYWIGKVEIVSFSHMLNLGKFVMSIPHANPYKWAWQAYGEPWLWDSFSFIDGFIAQTNEVNVNTSGADVILPKSDAPVVPVITISNKSVSAATVVVTYQGKTKEILGTEPFYSPELAVYDNLGYTLNLKTTGGTAKAKIEFRKGSL